MQNEKRFRFSFHFRCFGNDQTDVYAAPHEFLWYCICGAINISFHSLHKQWSLEIQLWRIKCIYKSIQCKPFCKPPQLKICQHCNCFANFISAGLKCIGGKKRAGTEIDAKVISINLLLVRHDKKNAIIGKKIWTANNGNEAIKY